MAMLNTQSVVANVWGLSSLVDTGSMRLPYNLIIRIYNNQLPFALSIALVNGTRSGRPSEPKDRCQTKHLDMSSGHLHIRSFTNLLGNPEKNGAVFMGIPQELG
jgi:hypothetical protein